MNVTAPEPVFVTEPVPLIAEAKLPEASWANSSSAALAIAPGRLVVEPISRPAEMVVVPE